jgi:integrase
MTKKIFNSEKAQLGSNEETSNSVLDQYQDQITSFYDAILVQETLRRKELGLPFSKADAEEFLNIIRKTFTSEIERSGSSLDMQKHKGLKNPLIEKAKNDGKHSTINLMKKTSIEEAVSEWLQSLSKNTLKGYERGIRALIKEGYIRLAEQSIPDTLPRTLFDFSNVPHDLVLEKILSHPMWSSSIKTRNGTSYKNFIKFLEGKTDGIISFLRIKPMFPKNKATSPVKDLSTNQIKQILSLLKDENPRDYCLVYLYLSSDLKLCETLELRKKDLDLKKNQDICNLLPYFQDLSDNDYIFRTRNGNPIDPMQISRTLQRTFKKIGIAAISLKDLKKIYGFHKNSFDIKGP